MKIEKKRPLFYTCLLLIKFIIYTLYFIICKKIPLHFIKYIHVTITRARFEDLNMGVFIKKILYQNFGEHIHVKKLIPNEIIYDDKYSSIDLQGKTLDLFNASTKRLAHCKLVINDTPKSTAHLLIK